MVEKSVGERFCIYWWNGVQDNKDTGWVQNLAMALSWPIPLEIYNLEVMNAG